MTNEAITATSDLLIEAESFEDFGGWKLDTEFIDLMGSPYLIAHGLGRPVAPASTTVRLPEPGRWFVWVRTKDWVPGPWEAPGRFKLAVNGRELPHVFGAESGEWSWERGGAVEVDGNEIKLDLIDLTGFDGRCDAIFLTRSEDAIPENSSEPMNSWRRRLSHVKEVVSDSRYDLLVVGGGIAGTAAAVAAARNGLKVALVQDRPVLGGNGSPEVRVAYGGNFPPGRFPHLGDIVKEITVQDGHNAVSVDKFEQAEAKRQNVVAGEPNLELFQGRHVYRVEEADGRIQAVWAMDTCSRQVQHFAAKYVVDATGHGTVGLRAGADYAMQPDERMGTSNLWTWTFTDSESEFPETPWALQLTEKGFPYPGNERGGAGDWYWESGFNKHPLDDLESIRDHNLRAVFGAWNAMKNHGAYVSRDEHGRSHATAKLTWVGYIGGPRETLQLLGDVVVSKEDITSNRDFPDACVPATWGIDLHYPMPLYVNESPDNPFISRAHFGGRVDDSQGELAKSTQRCIRGPAMASYDTEAGYLFPYRAFYSRTIENLFMAGRDISVTHDGLGTIRVMNTLGMVGVVVGRAAAIACRHNSSPREVYEKHLDDLKHLLSQPGDYRRS